jgi:hypothetical protein
MPKTKVAESDVIDILYQALQQTKHPNVKGISFDGDNKSAEIIMTTEDKDGTKRDWVISSSAIRESDREYDPELVTCKFCGGEVPAATAHRHGNGWVGDECCWDERLRNGDE